MMLCLDSFVLLLLLLVLLLVSVVVVCGMVVQWCGDCIDCVVMGLNIIIMMSTLFLRMMLLMLNEEEGEIKND